MKLTGNKWMGKQEAVLEKPRRFILFLRTIHMGFLVLRKGCGSISLGKNYGTYPVTAAWLSSAAASVVSIKFTRVDGAICLWRHNICEV